VTLATAAQKLIAPAMNQQMWRDPATAANIATLQDRGMSLVGPASGEQACGDIGPGRMEQPVHIALAAAGLFASGALAGRQVMITAGPTREALDPVRYLSNHSSGKMGYALARAAVDAGARVTLISGPVSLATPDHVTRVDVVSAAEMLQACMARVADCDLFIACAAVADYRPVSVAEHKIKKDTAGITLELERNADILTAVSAHAQAPFTVGFAAETRDVERYARDKLERKRLDMIVANDVSDTAIGFNSDHNAVTVLWRNGSQALAQASKATIARELVSLIAQRMEAADG
jgi:phosphopantothenoylcysteine decarboxylase/phosphopantothenate--cysteine ligase